MKIAQYALALCLTLTVQPAQKLVSQDKKSLPEIESISEFAKHENPTLKIAMPDPDQIIERLNKLNCDLSLYKTILKTVTYAREYTPTDDKKESGVSPTYLLCSYGMSTYVFYQFEQRGHIGVKVGYLKRDIKEVSESTLLYLLKKMEWVALRSPNIEDDYFKAYYYTLQRYTEITEGKIIVDGEWTVVKFEP